MQILLLLPEKGEAEPLPRKSSYYRIKNRRESEHIQRARISPSLNRLFRTVRNVRYRSLE